MKKPKKTKKFTTTWNKSKKPRKQRNYRKNAPLHLKRKMLGVNLSKDLRKKYNTRTITVVTGDKVKVLRGQFRKRENKVERVDLKKGKVFITGIERVKKDGSKSLYPLTPSNLQITDLKLEDKKRKSSLERKTAKGKVKAKSAEKADPVEKVTPVEKADPVEKAKPAEKAEPKPAEKKEGEQ